MFSLSSGGFVANLAANNLYCPLFIWNTSVESKQCLFFFHWTNQCKKFGKSDTKSCIEEFEEKLNKIHTERKEQEATAKKAQVQQKAGSLDGFLITEKNSVENVPEGNQLGFFFLSIQFYNILFFFYYYFGCFSLWFSYCSWLFSNFSYGQILV